VTINDVPATPLDMDIVRDDLLGVITDAITNHPRSLQKHIGPSEIGEPCTRKLGYKLLNHPEVADRGVPWYPTIGTAMHSWLEDAFGIAGVRFGMEGRYLLENKVDVGEVLGENITGSCDLFDTWTGSVVDWKIVGGKRLRAYKDHGPSEVYRAQAHLYGRGWQRAGHDVQTVAVFFLPRDRELKLAHFWHEPYDEQIAVKALQRLETVATLTRAAGAAALPLLPTTDSPCRFCPWLSPGSTDLAGVGCPGDPKAVEPSSSVSSLIA
jgi:hypothetical protein